MVGNIVCAMAKYFNFQGNDSYQKTFLKVVSEFYNFHSPYLPIQNSEGKSWRYLGLLGLSDDILSKLTLLILLKWLKVKVYLLNIVTTQKLSSVDRSFFWFIACMTYFHSLHNKRE